jgi:hypothetical protein
MDDNDANGIGERRNQREGRTRGPKLKYAELLQDIADRTKSHILVELDDLDEVLFMACLKPTSLLVCELMMWNSV